MRNIARPFALLLSIGWIAFWGAAIYLMWQPEVRLRLGVQDLDAVAQISAGGLMRLLGSLIGVAAIIMALPVLIAAFLPQRGRIVERHVDHDVEPANLDERRKTSEIDRRVSADYDSELSALRASVLRHDDEIRQLRSHRHGAVPTDIDEHSKAA
jgi:hypothetical protein